MRRSLVERGVWKTADELRRELGFSNMGLDNEEGRIEAKLARLHLLI
jgi:hypothetical protein